MKGAIFDWDGTLLDIDGREFYCINAALKAHGIASVTHDFFIHNYYRRPFEVGTGPRMVLETAIRGKNVEPDIVVLELTGKVTLGRESQRLEGLVKELLQQNVRKLVFDLSAVDYIDSAGMGVVAYCFGAMKEAGGEFRVAGAAGKVQNLFKITRLDTILPFFPTVAAACEGLATGQAGAKAS